MTGAKTYLYGFERFQELSKQMDKSFWAKYREAKSTNSADYPELKKMVSDYFYFKGEAERMSLNFPVQGSAAIITKISCIYIFDYLCENNLIDIVKFCNTIHDENILECPISIEKEIETMVGDCMVRAGEIFCKRVPLKADPLVHKFWCKSKPVEYEEN